MKSIPKTSFVILFCVSFSFIIQASEDWWPKLHFPKSFYNQENPRVFLDFIKKLQSNSILVQEYIEHKVKQQRHEAIRRLKAIYQDDIERIAFTEVEDILMLLKETPSESHSIMWKKTDIHPADKQIIEEMINKSSLKGTVVIQHLDNTWALKNRTIGASTIIFKKGKMHSIILIPDTFKQGSTHRKYAIIAHEIMHLELKHSIEYTYLETFSSLAGKLQPLERQTEFEADILANIQNFEIAKHFCKNYEKYKNHVIPEKDAIDRIHQLPQDEYHNSQIIFKLLAAQKVWFKTLPADEKYGQIAYEKAFETHYQKNNSFFNKLWSLKPF